MQLILFLFVLFSSSFHDLHLSMCNLSYNEEEQRIEVQQRIFFDDLEKSLQLSLEDEKFDILSPEMSELSYDSLFLTYINEHIDLSLNGVDVDLSLLEYEVSDEAVILFLYKANVPKLQALEIHSHILFEIYDDQDNVLSVNAFGKKKSKKFDINAEPLQLIF